ncbi:MAG: hypothetical protein PVS3B3_35980 [Ktedonobacteraceae bacterium]
MEEKKGRRTWFWRIVDFINPLRDPSLTVAAVLTFIEEVGQPDVWYSIIIVGLLNWLAVRGVVWLVVNFTFASTFISRRVWWAAKHPRLAWRILDAVGHEEIVIGGLPSLSEGIMMQDGTALLGPSLGASGIHVIGEIAAGTEVPLLSMPNGQMAPDFASLANTGMFPGLGAGYFNGNSSQQSPFSGQLQTGFPQTDGLPQSFPQRPSEEEERLRQQVAAYARLMDDWIQFTEEKWRTVSDSQLGWKPLRGRWGSWDDIFQDAYAAKTSDPMAKAAQAAGEATARRYDTSKEKGSAASAVACFMRDMMTLRRGFEMVQIIDAERTQETPNGQAAIQPMTKRFANTNNTSFSNGSGVHGTHGGFGPRSSLIRRPAPVFVDADTDK